MALTEHQKQYMKKRRRDLRARGICVDCQKSPAKRGLNFQGKPFTVCEECRQARTDRWHNGTLPPLFRAIRDTERVH